METIELEAVQGTNERVMADVEMIELTVEQLCDVGGGTTYVLY